jgi:hypothetical protein
MAAAFRGIPLSLLPVSRRGTKLLGLDAPTNASWQDHRPKQIFEFEFKFVLFCV